MEKTAKMTNSVLHLLVFEIVICWHKFEMSIKCDDHVYFFIYNFAHCSQQRTFFNLKYGNDDAFQPRWTDRYVYINRCADSVHIVRAAHTCGHEFVVNWQNKHKVVVTNKIIKFPADSVSI